MSDDAGEALHSVGGAAHTHEAQGLKMGLLWLCLGPQECEPVRILRSQHANEAECVRCTVSKIISI